MLATPRWLHWRHVPPPARTDGSAPPGPRPSLSVLRRPGRPRSTGRRMRLSRGGVDAGTARHRVVRRTAASRASHPSRERLAERPGRTPARHRPARWASPTAGSPTAPRSSTTPTRPSPGSTRACSVRCAAQRRMPGADVPRQQRLALPRLPGAAARRGGLDVRLDERRPPAGSPRPPRRRTSRATRSTSRTPTPRPGSPGTAPGTGCARSSANEPWHYELRPDAVDDGLPGPVRRPHARPEDAAVTGRPVTDARGDPHAVPGQEPPGRAVRGLPRAAGLDRALEARGPVGRRQRDGQAGPVRGHRRGRRQRTRSRSS